jgi:S-adenosyl-L-homocysteine hydrolase, NAD binding domain
MDMEKYLPKMPRLQWIHTYSAGVEKLLSNVTFSQSDILLTNSRGIHGIPMAEHVLGTMLASGRCLIEAWENQKAHTWKRLTEPDELFGKTAAIIGLGSIGREIAKHLKNMGMRVVAVKQTTSTEPFVDQLFTIDHLPAALSCADYIIVTLPLTPQTKKLFNRKTFDMMKENAFFINVSRGDVVEETDLVEALTTKRIRGASLDVFTTEPLPEDSPLWDVPNLFITPHHSAISPMYLDRSLKIFRNNLQIFPQRIGMLNVVDKQRGY